MEAVLENLRSSVELLAVAGHSGVVKQWDKETLSRALHWARYCEHISSRFYSNSAIRGLMEKQLQLTNQSLRDTIPGYTDVSFSDLQRCQHLLLVGLLNNPELPFSVLKILFDTRTAINSEDQDVNSLCSHIIQCKSACKVLSPLTAVSAVGADAEVQAGMLMERLSSLLNQSKDTSRAEQFLDSVLQECDGAVQHFCRAIAAALLTTNSSHTAPQDFLLGWLQSEHRLLQHMCSALPTTLLIDLAKQHQKFRDAYCDVLKRLASDMEYSLSDGEWVQTSINPTVTFQKLTEQFLVLFEACPSLRERTEKELNALKTSDGDFDVRGLSVWGDLLEALNQ